MECKQMGERVRKLREEKGYSQEQLAELTDISSRTLHNIETGKCNCYTTTLLNLAQVLEVDCDYLLTGKVGNIFIDDKIYFYVKAFGSRERLFVEQILKAVYELKESLLNNS